MTKPDRLPAQPAFHAQLLLDGHFKKRSKNASAKALGKVLRLHHKTVVIIANGGYCGKATAAKLTRLVANPHAIRDRRNDPPRVYTPVKSIAERELINSIPAARRRLALLALAGSLPKP